MDPEDQSASQRRIWQAFRSFRRVADGRHDTDDWRSHEGFFALCAIRVPAAALQPALDECRGAIERFPFVRRHPDHFLHITLQELGFVCDDPERLDEITPTRLEEFAQQAVAPVAARQPFGITICGANSFQDAIFLDVEDDGSCAELHGRLFDLAAIPRTPRFAYLPHATIAHYTRDAPADALPETLAAWRERPFGAFRVSEIEIVTLRLDEPYPPLETYAVIPLGG